jgi:UDP-N-acetyl-D-glucosamine dehydrogenase
MTTLDLQPLASRQLHDYAAVLAGAETGFNGSQREVASMDPGPRTDEDSLTANQVAQVVVGIGTIGEACDALTRAGWRATIAGNRITVNEAVFAQYIGAGIGSAGRRDPTWMIYAQGHALPIWVTAAESAVTAPSESVRDGLEHTRSPRASDALQGRRIAVVGLGYVGLPTALSFAHEGAEVVGFDVNEARLSAIKDLRADLLPRDKARLVHALDEHLLRLTTEPSTITETELVVICVPTPIDRHLTPDLTALSAACDTVVEYARQGQIIVLTSTTYAGCTYDLLVKPLQSRGLQVGNDVFVAFSPERIDPGVVEHTPEHTPRVVGGHTTTCSDRAARFLTHTAGALHLVSSPEVAEMAKLLENTFRAVNIALANEFADAASELNVNIMEVIRAASTKPYGFMTFYPGPGVGGHCIPCDPHYLLWQLRDRRVGSPVVEAAMNAIAARPRAVVAHAWRVLMNHGIPLRGARILVLGVSYKPGIGDVRESPALEIIEMLAVDGVDVSYSDPYVEVIHTPTAGQLFHTPTPVNEQWDLVIVHTAHPDVDHTWLASQPVVLDTTYRLQVPGVHVP